MAMKRTCTECNIEKDIEKFARNSHGRDGRLSKCKKCCNWWSTVYRQTERQKLSVKIWRSSYNGRKSQMLASAKQRAREKGIEFSIDIEDFDIPEFCPILGTPLVMNVGNP